MPKIAEESRPITAESDICELGLTGFSGWTRRLIAYWGVDDADAALERLLDLGATLHGEGEEAGEGIRVATVENPFGNVVGIVENPHFELPDAA